MLIPQELQLSLSESDMTEPDTMTYVQVHAYVHVVRYVYTCGLMRIYV